MKIYNNLFDRIISPENLFSAWEVFKADKQNKVDVIQFEYELEKNIFQLHRELKNGTYRHGPYYGFYIRDPKQRHIHKALVRDRILHHAIFSVINPVFEPTFISRSFSCRIGFGTHRGVAALEGMTRKVSRNNTHPCFVLKCDIRKFFDSVNQDTLIAILRYTDDFTIVADNPEYLKSLSPQIEKFLQEKLALGLHPKKVTIRQLKHGIDFLGYIIFPHHRLVRTKTQRRIWTKLVRRRSDYENGNISKATYEQSLQSYLGVLSRADTYLLRERILNEFWLPDPEGV
jgi:hypothetical protein